jgi:hypothetical protein
MAVVLLLLRVGDSHLSLSIAQGKRDLTRRERFTRRRNRHRYILHISTADLQPAGSWKHRGVSTLQGW